MVVITQTSKCNKKEADSQIQKTSPTIKANYRKDPYKFIIYVSFSTYSYTYHVFVESKKYNKLVNITKRKSERK